ncbi:MAG: hypothetical protein ACXVA9_03480, partial [Bdellovibrionales bacterium]
GDEEDLPRAARLLEHAAETGGNPWFKSLAARVYTRSGQYELGISTLESYKKLLTSDEDKAKIDARIKDLRTQEALSGEKAD